MPDKTQLPRARTRKQYLNYLHGLTDRGEDGESGEIEAVLKLFAGYSFSPLSTIISYSIERKIVPLMGRVNCRSRLVYQGTRNPRPIRYQTWWRGNYFKHDH